eukprot:SAG22_NODE_1717_length_3741_cov_24.176826_2_plen_253_part_00
MLPLSFYLRPCFSVRFRCHRTLPAGDYLLVVEGYGQSQGQYHVQMNCPPDLADACEAMPCRNGGTCTDVPGNRTHPAAYTCACAEGFTGERCGADNTIGEVGIARLSLPSRCSSPEAPDANGLTCGILISYGYRCATLIYPPYMYDCHCTCAGTYQHSAVVWTTIELSGEYEHPVIVTSVPTAADPVRQLNLTAPLSLSSLPFFPRVSLPFPAVPLLALTQDHYDQSGARHRPGPERAAELVRGRAAGVAVL